MDKDTRANTYFADPERAPFKQISDEVQACLDDPVVEILLNTVQGHVLVLNENRQFLAANQALLSALGRTHPELVGLRPGEVYNCIHIDEGPDGCGTSRHCRSCGAIMAILASRENHEPAEEECHLTVEENGQMKAAEFRVRCTPLLIGHHRLTVIVLTDVSHEKRRQMLERVFFHDLLNTIGGLTGWSSFLAKMTEQSAAQEIVTLSERLKEEIYFQRDVTEAEAGNLRPELADCDVADIFCHLGAIFRVHKVAEGRQLIFEPPEAGAQVHTDERLVLRVLTNMVKNALEATGKDEAVTVRFRMTDHRPVFEVHNPGVIPASVREHIFERSFSTRGEGRGLGTYSMKLFGENCLGGTVTFTSTASTGTVFRLSLPERATRNTGMRHESELVTPPLTPGVQNVLIMEPHPAVRRLAGLYMKGMGYVPHLFSDPHQALKSLRDTSSAYDLAIVDNALPVIPGVRFLTLVKESRPDLPIVFTTPFSASQAGTQDLPTGVILLPKPYTRNELTVAIEALFP